MKVLLIVSRRYNGHELWTALHVFQKERIEFEVVSTATIIQDEVTGEKNTIERTLYEVESLEGFDALMYVSGNMADTEAMWTDAKAQAFVLEAQERGIPLAAICCSVPTIRKAAKDKHVSFFPLVRSKQALLAEGAILEKTALTVDGTLVTAEHQMATEMWAENFVDVILGRSPRYVLHDSGYVPKSRPRKPIPELERLKKAQTKAEGPEVCPECEKHTEIRNGRVVCPFGCGDFTTSSDAS